LLVRMTDFLFQKLSQDFSQWAAGIPNFLSLYQSDLNKYSSQIKQTGQLPLLGQTKRTQADLNNQLYADF
jgi:hypothetical protein